jgi:site-specific recombinase XerC
VEFLATLRHEPSNRRAQRLALAATVDGGRLLSARTCNRILAAVSSFYEFLITCESYSGRANPIQKQADPTARRAVARWRPPLLNSNKQVPVRRTLRVKTVDALPRPISDEAYRALISVMRTKRDRALLELMHEGAPVRRWACIWRTSLMDAGGSPSDSGTTTRRECGKSPAENG